jgi:hypothetical protein
MSEPDEVVELRSRLRTPIAVPDDQLGHAFDGAARRVRRRRQSALAAATIAAVLVSGAVITALHVTDQRSPRVVATQRIEGGDASVLSTKQTPEDRSLRRLTANRPLGSPEWSSVRLLRTSSDGRLFGSRDRAGNFCATVVIGAVPADRSAFNGCTPARRFATNGIVIASATPTRAALALFVPDAARSATVDGQPVAITRNGLLFVTSRHAPPSRIVLISRRGKVVIIFRPANDGTFTTSGSLQ